MADFGGEMRFTYNAQVMILRAAISHNPSKFTAEKVVNQDGSVSRTFKNEAYEFEVTFEDGAIYDWDAILLADGLNITVVEDTTGVIHMWSGAKFLGRPSISRETGEVTGLTGVSRGYTKANR